MLGIDLNVLHLLTHLIFTTHFVNKKSSAKRSNSVFVSSCYFNKYHKPNCLKQHQLIILQSWRPKVPK